MRRRRSSSAAPIRSIPASSTISSHPTRISSRWSGRLSRQASAASSAWAIGKLQWSAGLFRTTLANDILPLQSAENGFGYYANVGTTLRQGAELSAQWRNDRWSAYANYTYIDAVYLTTFMEPSPFNPAANAAGLIPITNGTPIAGIPPHTLKVGVDFNATDKWKIGGDMVAASSQTIFGNENGALPQVPGYVVFGAHTSYQVSKQFQVFGLIQNIFNQPL